jgi:hypothetical protein
LSSQISKPYQENEEMQLRRLLTLLVIMLLASGSAAASVLQGTSPKSDITGKYEGVAKSDAIGELPITLVIKNEGGKLSGQIESPQGPAPITSGTYADGKLTVKLDAGGNEITLVGLYKDDTITGEWELAGQKGTFSLKRAGAAAAPATPAPKKEEAKPAPAAGDPITGEWDASADAGGTSIPFTLKLKLEGDKVTGVSASPQGEAAISKGSFAGDKISITLDTPNGAIVLTAMVKDGKMTGEFDFAGQATGKWEAKKK